MRLTALVLLIAIAGSVRAQGPAPVFSYVRSTMPEKGHAVLVRTQTVIAEEPYTEKVNINGKLVDVTRIKRVNKEVEVDTVYDLSASRVITANGKQLPIDEVWKRLKANTIVVISGGFETPPEAFLRALNPEVLVIVPALPKPPSK